MGAMHRRASLAVALLAAVAGLGSIAAPAGAASWEYVGPTSICVKVTGPDAPAAGGTMDVAFGETRADPALPGTIRPCAYLGLDEREVPITSDEFGRAAIVYDGPGATGATYPSTDTDPFFTGSTYDSTMKFDLRLDLDGGQWTGSAEWQRTWRVTTSTGGQSTITSSPAPFRVEAGRCASTCEGVFNPPFVPPPDPGTGGQDGQNGDAVCLPPDPACTVPTQTAAQTSSLTVANTAPVAKPETYKVELGRTVDETVLANDVDAEGDDIFVHLIRISFPKTEWSGLDRDGRFLYTAHPKVRTRGAKVITYEVLDARGARSAPKTATIRLTRPAKGRDPRNKRAQGRRKRAEAAANKPYWTRAAHGWSACFGSGLDSQCWTMLSVARTRAYNNEQSWLPDLRDAARKCAAYLLLPVSNKSCAQKIVASGGGAIWDKSVTRNAANLGQCLLWKVDRNRTLSHPFAGDWGKPQFSTDDSLTNPYSPGTRVKDGYGYWRKGFSSRWRIPLFCNSSGLVHKMVHEPLRDAG
jgi:Bacterial Ig domain